ncbi:MAG: peptidase S10 [Luteitalea sp.]|nr:peptidase S10 [Luteitalea sp.]
MLGSAAARAEQRETAAQGAKEEAKTGAAKTGAAKTGAAKTADAAKTAPEPAAPPVETQHRVRIGGTDVAYTATTGMLTLEDDAGKPKANVFFIAYTRDDVDDRSQRPLTFSFNGGPGSSSVWLHLGVLGPRRVFMPDDPTQAAPPGRLVENASSVLDVTDLVFVDPVSTGYSRPAEGEGAKQFHGVREDVQSVGDFIRLYLTRSQRWTSPKFLIGESYGTTRAAGLSDYLQDRHGVYLSGVVLVSSILNFQTARFDEGNDLPYVLFLPTYTATAWYHKKLAPELQADLKKTLDEARRFALGEYAEALLNGNQLSEADRQDLAQKVARLTGLSPTFVERVNLRVAISRFTKELLREQRLTVGRLDSRYTGRDEDAAGDRTEYDPSMMAITGPYTAAFNAYVRRDLKYENDDVYEILTGKVQPWKPQEPGRYTNVAPALRSAMARNPHLRVLVANGYYDLATPFFATEYTFNHLAYDGDYRERVRLTYYEAGHMMYIHGPSLDQLKQDLATFITAAASAPEVMTSGGK